MIQGISLGILPDIEHARSLIREGTDIKVFTPPAEIASDKLTYRRYLDLLETR
jgi:hypothetical protein